MGASDDLFKKFDRHAEKMDRRIKDDEEAERRYREHAGQEGRTYLRRIGDMLKGERPRRETNEEYRKRKESEAAKDLGGKRKKPDSTHHIVVRG